MKQLERLKKRFKIPIIASLNATTPLVWKDLARRLEAAGADAIELNLYELASTVERGANIVEAARSRPRPSSSRPSRSPSLPSSACSTRQCRPS